LKRVRSCIKTLMMIALMTVVLPSGAADTPTRGSITGGVTHESPAWFKESFLEIAEDVEEAAEADKQVLLFFQLNDCPYCDRMLSECFEAEPMSSYIQKHFDTIAINVRGDREIAFNEEVSVTEKQLSDILKVAATPAILFLNQDNKTVVRVNGYRAPERFRQILEFVASRSYRSTTLDDYLQARLDKNAYQLRANPLFRNIRDLSSVDGPLVLIFEDGSCYDCKEFHEAILAHPLVQKELEPFTVVRLDADSNEDMLDFQSKKTTPAKLARSFQMTFRPGILIFDDGNLLRRHDSLIFPHHFKESLRFVAGGFYRESDYRNYSIRRTEALLAEGVDINLGSSQ